MDDKRPPLDEEEMGFDDDKPDFKKFLKMPNPLDKAGDFKNRFKMPGSLLDEDEEDEEDDSNDIESEAPRDDL